MTSTVNSTKIVNIDDDPCLNSIVAESILPLIPERVAGTTNSFGISKNDHGSNSNDNSTTNSDGVVSKARSGATLNTSTGSSLRSLTKGLEGTQVS